MMRILYMAPEGNVSLDLDLDGLSEALGKAEGLLWVNLDGEDLETCRLVLHDRFGFHPLAVDDALDESHVPKVDDWGDYLYLVLHSVIFDGHDLDTAELDLFLGHNYLVTYPNQPIAAVDRVWALCQRDERHLRSGPAHLLYLLADELAADALLTVEELDETIDQIEDSIFDGASPAVLEQLFPLKRSLLHLRRIIAPEREVLNKLARGGYRVIDVDHAIFFRDVYDHFVRLYDITDSLRDLVSGAMDTYLSVVNNRMNDVMKVLTVITTLFMPISFLSGFFGMNFFQPTVALDAWTGHTAFTVILVAMILAPIGMLLWMRKRSWV